MIRLPVNLLRIVSGAHQEDIVQQKDLPLQLVIVMQVLSVLKEHQLYLIL
jgi:hypothetical protein